MRSKWLAALVLVALAGLGLLAGSLLGCRRARSAGADPGPDSAAVDSRVVSAQTSFGFRLFGELRRQQAQQNTFVSPASIALGLAMTYNGAAGETKEALAQALAVPGLSLDDFNRANAALLAALRGADPSVKLAVADSLWGRQGVHFRRAFLAANRQSYGAKVTTLDFADPRAAETINAWVRKGTDGRIDKIVEQVSADAMLFLINAIYFKGQWTDKFDRNLTREKPFTLPDSRRETVPLMSRDDEFLYLETAAFQAVELPYGKQRMSLYVFLPAGSSSLSAFCAQLNANRWDAWVAQFSHREGHLELPRFRLEYAVQLNEALSALGMGAAFDKGRADFAGMSDVPLYIAEVLHKTFVELNEEGTEAAAVTAVEMAPTVVAPEYRPKPFTMVVDRPFFCAIRDNQTGVLPFLGAIVEPS